MTRLRPAYAAAGLFALVGVVSAQTPTAPATSAAPLANDPRVASALELARTWVEAERAYEALPAVSVAVVAGQEVLWSAGYGVADLASKKPATADTIYSICSISKLFTSVALMREKEAGRVRLEDPVGKYLSWFRLARTEGEGDVTVEGVLTHASGLPRESDFPYWSPPEFKFPTHDDIVAKINSQSALYTPETHFEYSNLGLTLAGEIVAATSGGSYADYARTNILDPLHLSSTTPEMPEAERGKRLATGYSARDREGQRRALPFFLARGIAPAAGYASTANDLAAFARWQLRLLEKGGKEILKATTLKEMYRVHWTEPDLKTMWGLGFTIWRDDNRFFVGHGGSCPGYRTQLLIQPDERVATVFLTNAQGVPARRWAQRLYEIVAPALREAKKSPGAGKPLDASLKRYVGTYDAQPWSGEVAVFAWEDGLAMLSLPSTDPIEDLEKLKKTGEHRFRAVNKDESLGEEVVFEVGPDGRVTRFTRASNFSPRAR
jgi:CubicO group peptidase (beta-lactamase class C family)